MANTVALQNDVPRGNLAGFLRYAKYDILSGFLVFLIALPLCLGISLASGYPPMAGLFAAIVGALLTTFISNSEMTIKGPAAGLIVIAVGAIEQFGGDGFANGVTAQDMDAYRAALAVGVVAALMQIGFGILRAGILGEFFPTTVVHGMLAAIGVIIISKQIPVALGVSAKGEPLELLMHIPHFIREANPAIAAIGIVSLLIMFGWPLLGKRLTWLQFFPAQLVVVVVAIAMGMAFDLLHEHTYVLLNHKYPLSEQYLVSMPDRVFGMFQEITHPDFTILRKVVAWKWVVMFFLIGTLESMLSAKAVDLLDPWKRRTNLNRDIVAVGVANLASAMIGGLPMISEIVRSRANIDNGARTRFADFWHGVFLLACVSFLPQVLHLIPLAALAAMLVYTGYRLAHPKEFLHVYHIGREQLIIFVVTLVAVLATDLLVGVGIGILVKLAIHVLNGVPIRSLFKPYLDVEQQGPNLIRVSARESAVFSNWIPFRRQLEHLALVQGQDIVLDMTDVKLIDHTVMDKLYEFRDYLAQEGRRLELVGLDALMPVSDHQLAARRRGRVPVRRLVVVTDESSTARLIDEFARFGASGYTAIPCRGAGRRAIGSNGWQATEQVRLEVIVPQELAERLLEHLRRNVLPGMRATACVETVEAIFADQFAPVVSESNSHSSAGAVSAAGAHSASH